MIFNHTINIENNIAFINIEGELIEKNQATNLLAAVEELNAKGITKLALNLENLKYMNSSGLNTLIQLLTKARVGGGEAVLFNLNKKINELILITKLNTLFKIVSAKEEAIKLLE
jgi:anti-sigma B factor antagonist